MATILKPSAIMSFKIAPMWPFATASGLIIVNVLFVAMLLKFFAKVGKVETKNKEKRNKESCNTLCPGFTKQSLFRNKVLQYFGLKQSIRKHSSLFYFLLFTSYFCIYV